ncbi:MAG: hypothetical protein Q8Q52_07885 [Acidimicrobiia bacterium]|nr:hypothetical protein [Acidimicrobiia bacterium]
MTTLEKRLHDALVAGAAATAPSPDLFARVQGSVEADRRRRRLILRGLGVAGLLVLALGSLVFAVSEFRDGRLLMEWWVLELTTVGILLALALWLGPFIKRFGRSYAADVFRANPRTGKSFIVLVDIVYYLIFSAYILLLVRFERASDWSQTVGPDQLQFSVGRIAGILLIIGVLHGMNLLLMPVLGRLFSLNRHLDNQVPPEA